MATIEAKFNHGDQVKDTITGFVGVIVHIGKWMHGCIRYEVQAKEMKDGKVESHSFDEPQLVLLTAVKEGSYGMPTREEARAPRGGPSVSPSNYPSPERQ